VASKRPRRVGVFGLLERDRGVEVQSDPHEKVPPLSPRVEMHPLLWFSLVSEGDRHEPGHPDRTVGLDDLEIV
jgi:hypothetical protein